MNMFEVRERLPPSDQTKTRARAADTPANATRPRSRLWDSRSRSSRLKWHPLVVILWEQLCAKSTPVEVSKAVSRARRKICTLSSEGPS